MSSEPVSVSGSASYSTPTAEAAERRVAQIGDLLARIEVAGPLDRLPPASPFVRPFENALTEVRLGVASSLYRALRLKHEPTAKHSLRVTLACSAWSTQLGLSDSEHDQLELAALLHDIGKIGVPDSILTKPDKLTPPEAAIMDSHWLMGQEILRSSCASNAVLDVIAATSTWYDGSRSPTDVVVKTVPLESRMLAIVDAFDAMLADHVYRRAFTRERAFNELYRCAGTQFDPELVRRFSEVEDLHPPRLGEAAIRRWLRALEPEEMAAVWGRCDTFPPAAGQVDLQALFRHRLLANMFDAVVFIDANLQITQWNRGAERLTGITESSVEQRRWYPGLIELCDERGSAIRDDECPLAHAIRTGVQWLRRLSVRGRSGKHVPVDAHAVPVMSDGVTRGLALIMHDASSEITLEARCEHLHEKATKDPLTQLANRAEFDRALAQFITAHVENDRPCSLIICDIDRFKRVNDTYGHQAGDGVIVALARMLKSVCQTGDLAARYGGEEFVMLCADSNAGAAVRRAEELRRTFGEIRQQELGGKSVTVSFGVTEIQPGDTPETMLRRADRALLKAKERGRNRVVQLGSGSDPVVELPGSAASIPKRSSKAICEQYLLSEAPLAVCVEKLKGFVADHHAEIESAKGNCVRLRFGDESGWSLRRLTDRPLRLQVDLEFEELECDGRRSAGMVSARTKIHLVVAPQNDRDRRREQLTEIGLQLVASFRSYLMTTDCPPEDVGVPVKAKGLRELLPKEA
jgi:diguanylate cyclase (GGDEF)-like protein/PAS domain S-box-containing protein